MNWIEVNIDGLVGPTHNYAGLSWGNLASTDHRHQVSSPRRAALEGIQKMRAVTDLGIAQAVLPPQLRPHIPYLNACGFSGSVADVLRSAAQADPVQLAVASSAAAMWTANAATVSPAPDCADHRTHLTPANLISGAHRSLEGWQTYTAMKNIFHPDRFKVHRPLPASSAMADEGAANVMRVTSGHGQPGIEIFVFGRDAFDEHGGLPKRFPARQTRQAFMAIARRHGLSSDRVRFWQQSPCAIDAGAFHNDVVAVANGNVLLCHQDAFADQSRLLGELENDFRKLTGSELHIIEVPREKLSLADAVETYLFNSQIVTVGEESMVMVCPAECQGHPAAAAVIQNILQGRNPIEKAIFPNVRQSMMNGGGPACLRLRVVMREDDWETFRPGVRFDDRLEASLVDWVERHYRDSLHPEDLADAGLFEECRRALVELETLLGLNPGVLSKFPGDTLY